MRRGSEVRARSPHTRWALKTDDPSQPEFANRTDNSYHVVVACGAEIEGHLDGFTIRGGHTAVYYTSPGGAGICFNRGTGRIENCLITDNLGSYKTFGGGIWFGQGSGCGSGNPVDQPQIIKCTVQGNSAWSGGGITTWGSYYAPNISNCVIEDNEAIGNGGGVFFAANTGEDSSTMVNTLVVGNTQTAAGSQYGGGGVYLYQPIFPSYQISNHGHNRTNR